MAKNPHIEILAALIPHPFEQICSPAFEAELDAMSMDAEHVLAGLFAIHGYQMEEGIVPTPMSMATVFIDDVAVNVYDEVGDPSDPESWEECDRKLVNGIGRFKPQLIQMAEFVNQVMGRTQLPVEAVETRRYPGNFMLDLSLTRGR